MRFASFVAYGKVLVVANRGRNSISMLVCKGDGTFAKRRRLWLGNLPVDVRVWARISTVERFLNGDSSQGDDERHRPILDTPTEAR